MSFGYITGAPAGISMLACDVFAYRGIAAHVLCANVGASINSAYTAGLPNTSDIFFCLSLVFVSLQSP